jgi:hypothetical protein
MSPDTCGKHGPGRNQVILFANAFNPKGCGDNNASTQGTMIHEISHICIARGQGNGPDCDVRQQTVSGPLCSEETIRATNTRTKDLEENCSGE